MTLATVLAALELKADRIAVEHNGRIGRRSAWGETAVQAGDKLEIVHFVGGGTGPEGNAEPHWAAFGSHRAAGLCSRPTMPS